MAVRRRRGCRDGDVVSFGQWRSVVREARREVAAAFGQRRCRPTLLWRGRGAWQPRGEGALTGGPGAERETDRWVPLISDF
jgi:hypothetical protein